ncbi:g4537 [Coccomyxa viridis]|uniref:G4537 protein n=1 Tax=Coccomyxa viridis TaxID=1274662 RepID=A0ABP1FS16_9CHLO
MGKVPIRLKEVVYTISPFETTVMSGLFKDVPGKLAEKIKHNWVDIGLFGALPTYLTMWYAADYVEKEKQHHRF